PAARKGRIIYRHSSADIFDYAQRGICCTGQAGHITGPNRTTNNTRFTCCKVPRHKTYNIGKKADC
ncbi:MAG: hypothetical protein ABR545_01120, partial [Cyclonatronaceae bacterium]